MSVRGFDTSLSAIRERHAAIEAVIDSNKIDRDREMSAVTAHLDRGALLIEVDRLRTLLDQAAKSVAWEAIGPSDWMGTTQSADAEALLSLIRSALAETR